MSSGSSERWRWPHLLSITAALLLAVGLGWWARPPDLGTGGDDATYISLSHSLERGRYREEFRLDAPRHGQYPPGTPAFLLAVRALAGPGLDPIHAASLLLLALSAILMGDAVRRLGGAWAGAGVAAATALNPTLLTWAGPVGSDLLYLALTTIALRATLLADERGDRSRWPLIAVAAGLAGFLTRIVGVSLLAGIALWAWQRRRPRTLLVLALLSALVVGTWFVWSARVAAEGAGSSYARDFQSITAAGEHGGLATARRMAGNALAYSTGLSLDGLGLPMSAGTPLDNLVWLVLLAVPLGLGVVMLARAWPAAVGALGVGAAILVVWVGQYPRFLVPFFPTIIAALVLGFARLGDRLPARFRTLAVLIPALGLAAAGATRFVARDRWHRCDRAAPFDAPGCFDAPARELVAAARFIRDSLPQSAVVATAEPSTVAWFSGRPTVLLAGTRGRTSSDGATVLLLGTASPAERNHAAPALSARCGEFVLLKAISPATLVLAPLNTAPQRPVACPALASYLDSLQKAPGGTDSAPF